MPPPRNDARNDTTGACPVCAAPFTRAGRRRYCSDACRQAAWRRRAGPPPGPVVPLLPPRPRRQGTVYQCASCDTRYLSQQWCPDCTRPCRRLGPGGYCACSELLTIDELLNGS
jgi:hypothetical protein